MTAGRDEAVPDSFDRGTRPVLSQPGLRVDLVSDGVYYMDGGAMFGVVPKSMWARRVAADAANRVPLALSCMLIRDGSTTLLADTGFGTKLTDKELAIYGLSAERPGLVAALAELGVEPADIDVVVNTHLHYDHCGGNTTAADGDLAPTFPKARYLVQRIELAEALFPNERTRLTYVRSNFEPLLELGRLEILEGDTRLTSRVRVAVTPGHTATHQCVIVEPDAGPPVFYCADLAPRAPHLERVAWVPAVDVLPLDSLETKRKWARWLAEANAVCVLEHDDATPLGRLTAIDSGFVFQPEAGRS